MNLETIRKVRCKKDFNHWLNTYCYTKNEKDNQHPVALFPSLPYIAPIVSEFDSNNVLFIEKSRQLMVSWLFTAVALHLAQFTPYRKILFISKSEADAEMLIDRVRFMYDHQPAWLKKTCALLKPWRDQPKDKVLMENGSEIISLPAGAHKVRGHVASMIFADEAAFQDKFDEIYAAMVPSVQGGGRLAVVSTALPGHFEKLVEASNPGPSLDLCKGLTKRITQQGFTVLRLHYSADPTKDAATTIGQEWLKQVLKFYPGGLKSPQWRRENEIDYSAGLGELVIPWFSDKEDKICFDPYELSEQALSKCTFFGGFDWGMRNLVAFVVIAKDAAGNFWKVWEWGANQTNALDVAKIVKGCPYYHRLQWIAADPSMWNNNQHSKTRDGKFTSHAEIFLNELPPEWRIDKLMRAHDKNDMRFVASLQLRWLSDRPSYRIARHCLQSRNEYRNLKYANGIGTVNQPEKLLDKDNHFFDADKYCLMSHPDYIAPQEAPKYGTVGYLLDVDQTAQQLSSASGISYQEAFEALYIEGDKET